MNMCTHVHTYIYMNKYICGVGVEYSSGLLLRDTDLAENEAG